MVDEIRNTFGGQRTNSCLSSDRRTKFYIAENDNTSQSYIVPSAETSVDVDKCLVVLNPDSTEIFHLSIDACFLTQQHGYNEEKCDFVVFNDGLFCFVELKSNAESEKRVLVNLEKARRQLGATINFFDDYEVDFSNHFLRAYIVLKNKLYPQDQASMKERRKKFFDDYEVDLFEESEVEF